MQKVSSFQSGGPFMIYKPLPMAPVAQPVTGAPSGDPSGTAKSEGVVPDAFVKEMLGKGLTNDVIAFTDEVNKAYKYYESLSDMEKESPLGAHLREIMKGDKGKLNQMSRAAKAYDDAVKVIRDNDSGSDFAVTNRGVIVKDMKTGKLAEVSHADYAENYSSDSQYKMLTNSELMTERENNPLLVGDLQSLEVLTKAIGISQIRDKIRESLANLGSDSKSSSNGYLFAGNNESVVLGAKQLMGDTENSVSRYFKRTEEGSAENNDRQIEAAAIAMWANLDNNAKSQLRARAVQQGAKGEDIETVARGMAISLLDPARKTSSSTKVDTDYEAGLSASGRSGGGSETTTNVEYFSQFAANDGDDVQFTLTLGDENDWGLNLYGKEIGAIPQDGKPMPGGTRLSDLHDFLANVNTKSITFGGKQMNPEEADAIVYSGDSLKLTKIPATAGANGQPVPDLSNLESYGKMQDEISKEIKNNPRVTAQKIASIISSYGFGIRKNKDAPGGVEADIRTDYFAVFEGKAKEGALNGATKKFLKKATDTEEDRYYSNFMYGNDDGSGKKISGVNDGGWSWFNFGQDDVYSGLVFVNYKPGRAVSASNTDRTYQNTPKDNMSRANLLGKYSID